MSGADAPRRRVTTVALVVADYDGAIAWYTEKLGFHLIEDVDLGDGRRWVTVEPGHGGCRLLLAKAANADEALAIGKQAGGRVFLLLETDDFDLDYATMTRGGVVFEEVPRRETYGTVAVFQDLYGNRWDLIEPARSPQSSPTPPI